MALAVAVTLAFARLVAFPGFNHAHPWLALALSFPVGAVMCEVRWVAWKRRHPVLTFGEFADVLRRNAHNN